MYIKTTIKHALSISAMTLLLSACNNDVPVEKNTDTAPITIVNNEVVGEQLYEVLPADVVPELADKGIHKVGVKTITLINPAQFDPMTQSNKDRSLTIELWYPADVSEQNIKAVYRNETRGGTAFTIASEGYRDANVTQSEQAYPLVILSHGYTGYRTLMFYIGEHLASHGYIVAAIDHTDSTNADVDTVNAPFSGFVSTLLNRSRDQHFVLNNLTNDNEFFANVIDTENAGLIGYSMGGYGAVNSIGGCYNFSDTTAAMFTGTKDAALLPKVKGLLNSCAGGNYIDDAVDPRWKAAIAYAPWGGQHGLFNLEKLAKTTTPILYVSGNLDDISGYQGIKSLYKNTGSDSKYLLTLVNARHNIAGHPAPKVARENELEIGHYYEPAWSTIALNNINKHFALAMMDCHIKNINEQCEYLNLSASSDQESNNGEMPKPWKGFDHRYSTGMRWEKNQ